MIPSRPVIAVAMIVGAGLGPAVAADAATVCSYPRPLTMTAAHAAAADGRATARSQGSYTVKPWLVFESPDPLRAAHGQAGVDAVIAETPYERIRYESFLDSMQGSQMSGPALAQLRAAATGRFGFIVYAHSRNGEDRGFLGTIGHAGISVAGRNPIAASSVARFGPASDFYSVGDFREIRWTGSATFRFAAACIATGTFRFSDGYGHVYTYPFDLSRYK